MARRLTWLFATREPVGRGRYLAAGLTLAAVKYTGDVAIVRLSAGQFWTPSDYVHSVYSLLTRFGVVQTWLLPALAVWTLPFLWVGVTLTLRRTEDAGWSSWFAMLFFVPYLNYALMTALCIVGSAPRPDREEAADRVHPTRLSRAVVAIPAGMAVGLAMFALAVKGLAVYSSGLFLGTPFGMGALSAFIFNRRRDATAAATYQMTALMFVLTAGAMFLLATEGAMCIAMALPIAIVVGGFGAAAGRAIARRGRSDVPQALFALLVLPLATVLEPRGASGRVLHEVMSAVEIDAPADVVWRHVVAFQPIPEPTDLVFRLGIAYPMYARIDGQGVGATRYCVFSTGAFVEPITAWEPGQRLSFDVANSPAPLRELSPYANLSPPHLSGYLRSRRGEFRLLPSGDGRTRLEGRTWYEIDMAPEAYWQVFSDALIHRIHMRVLAHVKREAEMRR